MEQARFLNRARIIRHLLSISVIGEGKRLTARKKIIHHKKKIKQIRFTTYRRGLYVLCSLLREARRSAARAAGDKMIGRGRKSEESSPVAATQIDEVRKRIIMIDDEDLP